MCYFFHSPIFPVCVFGPSVCSVGSICVFCGFWIERSIWREYRRVAPPDGRIDNHFVWRPPRDLNETEKKTQGNRNWRRLSKGKKLLTFWTRLLLCSYSVELLNWRRTALGNTPLIGLHSNNVVVRVPHCVEKRVGDFGNEGDRSFDRSDSLGGIFAASNEPITNANPNAE